MSAYDKGGNMVFVETTEKESGVSDREAMQEALEALQILWVSHHANRADAAIDALKTALAKPDEIESLRQRVKELEHDRDIGAKDYCDLMGRYDSVIVELAAIKAGQEGKND